jgi:hypothetical protein
MAVRLDGYPTSGEFQLSTRLSAFSRSGRPVRPPDWSSSSKMRRTRAPRPFAQPSINSRCTDGEMNRSPLRPPTLDTRTYRLLRAALGSTPSQHRDRSDHRSWPMWLAPGPRNAYRALASELQLARPRRPPSDRSTRSRRPEHTYGSSCARTSIAGLARKSRRRPAPR